VQRDRWRAGGPGREEDALRIYTGGGIARHAPYADEIVEAACAFGQQDDITVVTMMRLARFAAVEMATLDLRETAAPA
jgi:hypothetical protein